MYMHVCTCGGEWCLKQIGGGVLGRVNSTCKGLEAETNVVIVILCDLSVR